jgi:hypothetical protein
VLLNKCQEEFEAGDQAMAAVDAREKAAAAKVAAGEVRRGEGRLARCVASQAVAGTPAVIIATPRLPRFMHLLSECLQFGG